MTVAAPSCATSPFSCISRLEHAVRFDAGRSQVRCAARMAGNFIFLMPFSWGVWGVIIAFWAYAALSISFIERRLP